MTRELRSIAIRPGLLVNLSSRHKGGVEYEREELEHEVQEKTDISSWKTEKKILDVDEYRLASQAQSRVRSLIRSACVWTPFGNICPTDQEETLRARIAEAEQVRDTFNATSVHSKIQFSILTGRIAENSREAVTAVRDEIRSLLGELSEALTHGNVEEIRQVAAQANSIGRLLQDETEAKTALQRAVKESRRVATELVKRVEEGADALAEVLAGTDQKILGAALHAFDEEDTGEIAPEAEQAMLGVDLNRFAGIGGEEYVPPTVPEYTEAELALFNALFGAISPRVYFEQLQDEPGVIERVAAQIDFEAQRRKLPEGWAAWTAQEVLAFIPPRTPTFTAAERDAFLRLYDGRTPEEYFQEYSGEPDLETSVRNDLASFMAVDAAGTEVSGAEEEPQAGEAEEQPAEPGTPQGWDGSDAAEPEYDLDEI